MTVKISAATNIDAVQLQEQAADPSTPASGFGKVYEKSDGTLYFINDAGTVFTLDWMGDIGARVYNDANISIANTTSQALTFNQERYDTDGIHSGTSSQLYCNTAGKYVISGCARYAQHTNGERYWTIRLNDTVDIAENSDTDPIATANSMMNLTTIYNLAVNDYVEFMVWQNSGGALNIEAAGNKTPEFMMQRIG